jgi:hypothetical protein
VDASYSIHVGRDEKQLRYTMAERRALEAKFGCALYELLMRRAGTENAEGFWTPLGGQWDVQVEILFQGLRHLGAAITRAKVEAWMQAAIDNETGGTMPYLVSAANAIMASGVLGMKYARPAEEPEKVDESGKAEDAPASESGAGS